ncbi:MAG TPA: DMT family transporter [Candidatus Latescibacteria bacterium]|nr:DMT family transporter [Candidatus Latescibacterota bacterium]
MRPDAASTSPTGRRQLGLGLALATACIWGSLPIILKGLLQSLDPYTITWCRFAIMAALLGAQSLRGGLALPTKLLSRKGWVLLPTAAAGLCANYLLYMMALDYLTPNAAQVVIQLSFVFMLLGGLVLFRETFAPVQWLGVGLLVAGMGLFFNDRLGEVLSASGPLATGVAIMVVAALLWATYGLTQKQLQSELTSRQVLLFVFLAGTVAFLPGVQFDSLARLRGLEVVMLGGTALVTLVSYLCFAESLKHIAASRVSVVLALTPLVTMAGALTWAQPFPLLFEPEELNALSLLGVAAVVAGAVLAALGAPPRRGSGDASPEPSGRVGSDL